MEKISLHKRRKSGVQAEEEVKAGGRKTAGVYEPQGRTKVEQVETDTHASMPNQTILDRTTPKVES
jgi:hypothetical protein